MTKLGITVTGFNPIQSNP